MMNLVKMNSLSLTVESFILPAFCFLGSGGTYKAGNFKINEALKT